MHYMKTVSFYVRISLLGLLSALAACGGKSEQEEACDQAAAGYFPILNGIKCVFGSTNDGGAIQSGFGASSSADSNLPLGDQIAEYEPNTSLNNANPLVINDTAIAITGRLAFADDAADNFVFTPTHTGDYRVFLCADSCDHALASDTLDLTVLDQSQTTIAAASPGPTNEKALSIRLNAGVTYYTQVSTFGTGENYRLAFVPSASMANN